MPLIRSINDLEQPGDEEMIFTILAISLKFEGITLLSYVIKRELF